MGYTSITQTPIVTGLYTLLLPLAAFALLGSSRLLVVGGDSATAAILAAGLTAAAIPGVEPGSPRWAALCALVALATGGAPRPRTRIETGIPWRLPLSVSADWFPFRHRDQRRPEPDTRHHRSRKRERALDREAVGMDVTARIGLCPHDRLRCRHHRDPVGVQSPDPENSGRHRGRRQPPDCRNVDESSRVRCRSRRPHRWWSSRDRFPDRSERGRGCGDRLDGVVVLLHRDRAERGNLTKFRDEAGRAVGCEPRHPRILDTAKGRTQVATLVVVALTLVVVLFLTDLLEQLPIAVLAGVVLVVGVGLIDLTGLRRIAKSSRGEFIIAVITTVTVVVGGVIAGITVAIALSLLSVIARQYRTPAFILQTTDQGYDFLVAAPGVQSRPGLIVYRFNSELFFANAVGFTEHLEQAVDAAPDPVRWVILDCAGIPDVDYSAGEQLVSLIGSLHSHEVHVVLARPEPALLTALDTYDLLAKINPAHIYTDLDLAIAAFEHDAVANQSPTLKEPS
ncbi:hypothetical protein HA402_010395 [Bradysia odoriphaga]|nr:hypothetical protein HA402_010395 [Bradysia odoriphaga]